MAALRAGKHVICEKPLAMNLQEADAMIAEAAKGDFLLVANLMQRYNPVTCAWGIWCSRRFWANRSTAISRTTPRMKTWGRTTGAGTGQERRNLH